MRRQLGILTEEYDIKFRGATLSDPSRMLDDSVYIEPVLTMVKKPIAPPTHDQCPAETKEDVYANLDFLRKSYLNRLKQNS